ncbi:methyltransferase [Caldalkalibacillus thermarum]|uniref:class I SAM-dependent methyltransferase n=1 Tax=Caldalkalibacillus thermarum TaxID=296745 RepID=UPI0016686C3F|nr:class I SAM-dependent methyltransferase [Caldalkalibacillus thermarum]GGK12323.1 methyltransferase [Caldalkalibacillus thermarum]
MGEPWYVHSFTEDYLKIYAHRNDEAAEQEVAQIVNVLGMKKGSAVLDLCCGHGRHSRALARRGFQVTGLDLSQVLLAEAEKRNGEFGIRYVQGDVRHIPFTDEFDYVLNLFTSFGYFETRKENLSVFRGISSALKTNGQFLIDFLNPGYVKRNLVPYTERQADKLFIVERRQIQGNQVVKTIEVREGEQVRHYKEQVQLFTYEEMEEMMKEAGLKVTDVYGSLEQEAYDPVHSPRMIIIGERG